MPRSCLTIVGLLAVLTTTRGLAQTAEEPGIAPPPSVDLTVQLAPVQDPGWSYPDLRADAGSLGVEGDGPVFADSFIETVPLGPTAGEVQITDEPIGLDGLVEVRPTAALGDFRGYRYLISSLAWVPGNGDQFGILSLAWNHYQPSGIRSGLGVGMGFHFLSGPDRTDMPPRVYDFSLAYQIRDRLGPVRFDLAASVLAASDFEGDSSDGILFPGHAVGFLSVRPTIDLVFGVDYLDRGDARLLPVGGLIWTPTPEMRFELVFPRPRAVLQLGESRRYLYVSGGLGGGTWAIERADLRNDLATYHELRLCVGVSDSHDRSAFEVGYLFDRHLEYSSGIGNMPLDDAVMVRLVTTF
jgi:hypothetical protein